MFGIYLDNQYSVIIQLKFQGCSAVFYASARYIYVQHFGRECDHILYYINTSANVVLDVFFILNFDKKVIKTKLDIYLGFERN